MTDADRTEAFDTLFMLPAGTSAAELARDCREAALEFVNQSERWGHGELATWLTGPYATLVRYTSKREAGRRVWPRSILRNVDPRLIDRIMRTAREEVRDTLARIARDGSASFVIQALISGTVMRCEDGAGEPTWAPTGAATRLADRVLSLFAVDYLARPVDYETRLSLCEACRHVSFDETARLRGLCSRHASVGRLWAGAGGGRRLTLPYPPIGA